MKLSKNPSNQELAELLRAIAAALKIKNANQFRIISYERAADSLEHTTTEAKTLWSNNKLIKLPGIGSNIANHLDEIFRTGKSKHFETELKDLPPGMFPLLKIPNIGPKNAYRLSMELGLTHEHSAISKLEKAAKQNEIQKLKGFQADAEAKILANIQELKHHTNRILLHHADKISTEIINYLKKIPEVVEIYALGSLRRRVSTVGDIDIAVATNQPKKIINHFIKYPTANKTVKAGNTTATILINNNIRIDLITQKPDSFGSLLQHFTGSKHHNIHLREIAQKKGWSLSEKGIKSATKPVGAIHELPKNARPRISTKTFSTEKQLYNFLNLQYIPPELRENTGEIVVGAIHELPLLIKPSDIKGDFHLHSNFPTEPSHDLGLNSMEQMIEQAIELGYQYLAFSEHNPSLSEHSNQQIIDIIKRKQENVFRLNEKYEKKVKNMKILNSLEIDIRPTGKLALPNKAFDHLDFAIVSVHSSFRQTRKQTTERVLKALQHPKVKIFGHPTGRILNKRKGINLDWEKIFDYCLTHHKWLEIDGWPNRLDLPDTLAKQAIELGIKLTIDSDAHQTDHMHMLKYGVSVARRAWASKKDIINTLSWQELKNLL